MVALSQSACVMTFAIQRQAIEVTAERGHGAGGMLGKEEVRLRGLGSLHEKGDGRRFADLSCRIHMDIWHGQRGYPQDLLATHVQWRTTSGQHL
jgi:hypothetical protein